MPRRRKNEPPIESLLPSEKVDVKALRFGEWAICPKCHARIRKVACKVCGGTGVVPNQGPIPFLRTPGD